MRKMLTKNSKMEKKLHIHWYKKENFFFSKSFFFQRVQNTFFQNDLTNFISTYIQK